MQPLAGRSIARGLLGDSEVSHRRKKASLCWETREAEGQPLRLPTQRGVRRAWPCSPGQPAAWPRPQPWSWTPALSVGRSPHPCQSECERISALSGLPAHSRPLHNGRGANRGQARAGARAGGGKRARTLQLKNARLRSPSGRSAPRSPLLSRGAPSSTVRALGSRGRGSQL